MNDHAIYRIYLPDLQHQASNSPAKNSATFGTDAVSAFQRRSPLQILLM
jgi:hypothetical protein